MINVWNLQCLYPKASTEAIKDLSFNITKGEIFGFWGPSGAGKTTTQRLIIGLLIGYSGSIGFGNGDPLWTQRVSCE